MSCTQDAAAMRATSCSRAAPSAPMHVGHDRSVRERRVLVRLACGMYLAASRATIAMSATPPRANGMRSRPCRCSHICLTVVDDTLAAFYVHMRSCALSVACVACGVAWRGVAMCVRVCRQPCVTRRCCGGASSVALSGLSSLVLVRCLSVTSKAPLPRPVGPTSGEEGCKT